jgi:single-stranded-DNA-specific exonuclease
VRLRQGNASVYAIWFGMPTAKLAYGAGAAVDVALQLSVYDGARGAQLSGRVVEMHPAGFGPQQAAQAALAEALRRGTPLAEEEKAQIRPARADIVAVYREIQQHAWHAEDLQPLLARMGAENAGKTLVALTALEQVGLVQTVERDGAHFLALVPTQEKRNLADAPILQCLAQSATQAGGEES